MGNNINDYLPVRCYNTSRLECESNVFNLFANTPLTLTFPEFTRICSVEFTDTNGKKIHLGEDVVGNQLTICARQDLANIAYKIIGETPNE